MVNSWFKSVFWRISRKLYMLSRSESLLDHNNNGEFWLVKQFTRNHQGNKKLFVDIGARFGEWTDETLDCSSDERVANKMVVFDPAPESYSYLKAKYENRTNVDVRNLAVSDGQGEVKFYVDGPFSGINSLEYVEDSSEIEVATTSLDLFLSEWTKDYKIFVKCDTEGHDLYVIKGAKTALKQGKLEMLQFEYNHRWIGANASLHALFEFMADMPYSLGKLKRNHIEVYEKWHPELERYFEANYVLVHNESILQRHCVHVTFNKQNVPVPG